MKLLCTGVACRPNEGSESGAGWNWVLSLSKDHDVTILTSIHNEYAIENWLKEHPNIKIKTAYVGSVQYYNKCKGKRFGYNRYYVYWLSQTEKKVRELVDKGEKYDFIHHLTYSTFKYYVPLCNLDIPFILGPAGGGEMTPDSLLNSLEDKRGYELLRTIQLKWALLNPKIRFMLDKAVMLLATTNETADALPLKYKHKVKIMQAIGISSEEIVENKPKTFGDGKLQIIYAGRIEMWKGIIPLVDAIKVVHERNKVKCIVNVYGDGADLQAFKTLVKDKGIENLFNFTGRISRDLLLQNMDNNDVFIYTSFRDSGSMAVIEAMCRRIPVLCFDVGGQRDTVNSNNGYKVAIDGSYSDIINDLADKIELIYRDYMLGAVDEILDNATDMLKSNYVWDIKAKKMSKLYEKLKGSNDEENFDNNDQL